MKKYQPTEQSCCLLAVVTLFLFVMQGHCDVPLHFQFVFGPNPVRAEHMKAEDLFDSQLDIELARACAAGDTNRMQLLIGRGANVNSAGSRGMTPLFWALIHQNITGFKYLLDHGADPNAVVRVKEPPPENALTLAASMDNPQFLEELLSHGANPNATAGSAQYTAIFTAQFYKMETNIMILLKHGGEIDRKSSNGNTPLHQAIYENSYGMALFLYHAGANPIEKNKLGYSPVETMKQFGAKGAMSRKDKKAYRQLLEELTRRQLYHPSD